MQRRHNHQLHSLKLKLDNSFSKNNSLTNPYVTESWSHELRYRLRMVDEHATEDQMMALMHAGPNGAASKDDRGGAAEEPEGATAPSDQGGGPR